MADLQQGDGQATSQSDWLAPLRSDPELAPHVEKVQEKDFPTFFKSHINLEKKLGDTENRVKQELTAKGLLKTPAPEKYTIARPENLPEGGWNDALEAKAHAWAKKHGLPQAALDDALGLYNEAFEGFGKAVAVDRQAQAAKVKEWADKEGINLEEVDAALDRFNKDPNGWDVETAEAVSKSGYADHPLVVQAIYKLVKDSGIMDTRNESGSTMDGQVSAEESEITDLMAKLNDPRSPDYAKYNTKENQAKIDAYWVKKGQGKQFQIS